LPAKPSNITRPWSYLIVARSSLSIGTGGQATIPTRLKATAEWLGREGYIMMPHPICVVEEMTLTLPVEPLPLKVWVLDPAFQS
jgi:hypothetical protein